MTSRLLLAALFALPVLSALPASAQSTAQFNVYEGRQLQNACPRGLKFAAGACVPECPAGYEDNGSVCRYRLDNRW